MEAKDTVMKERGADYDANCGQSICCDILPKYINDIEGKCYTEISIALEEFVESERKTQAEISFKAGQEEERRKHKDITSYYKGKRDGRLQGRKEVVDYIEEQNDLEDEEPLPYYVMNKKVWQAKKKEWFKISPLRG